MFASNWKAVFVQMLVIILAFEIIITEWETVPLASCDRVQSNYGLSWHAACLKDG